MTISFAERLATAFVSAVAATLTLALYPIALLLFGRGGGGEIELGAMFYGFIFSNTGFVVISGAFLLGFLLGSERMANVFSFFWGTHPFWSRLDELHTDTNVGSWVLLVLILLFVAAMIYNYA